jgi:HlyD family secretion protein
LEVGEFVGFGVSSPRPLLGLIDLAPRMIKGHLDEVDWVKVKNGMPARVKIHSVRPTPFLAQVSKVMPTVNTEKDQDRTVQVELNLTERSDFLLPVGSSADVEIIVQQKDRILSVPTQAIFQKMRRHYLHVLRGPSAGKVPAGTIELRDVQLGIGNYERTEILQGITEGEVVVFPPENQDLPEGAKVKVEVHPWP